MPDFWICNVSNIKSLQRLLRSYWERGVFRTLSSIYNGAFFKQNNAWMQAHNQKFFRAGEGFVERGHFDKYFVRNIRKKAPTGKHFEGFSPIFCILYFEWKIQPKDGHNQVFFPKSRTQF